MTDELMSRPPLPVGLMLATVADLDTGAVDTARVVTAARRAEDAGFDGVYVGDHLLHPHPILESIVTLSVVAGATERVTIGTAVLLAALRQPIVLAKQLGTLAAFAPGRVRIGVGVGGEYPEELEAAGVAVRQRGRALDASLAELRDLLVPDEDARLALGPVSTVPLFFGGWSDAALRRAARNGGSWIGYLLNEAGFARRRARLAELAGSTATSAGMLLPVHVVDADEGAARAEGTRHWNRVTGTDLPAGHVLAGRPEAVATAITRFVEAGCDEVILAAADQGAGHLAQVDLLAHEILPRLRTAGATTLQ